MLLKWIGARQCGMACHRRAWHGIAAFLLLGVWVVAFPAPVDEQTPLPVTIELLEAKIKDVQAGSGLDEAARGRLVELYRGTQAQIEALRGYEAAIRDHAKAQESALRELDALRKALAKPTPKADLAGLHVTRETPLADVQPLLAEKQAEKSALETRLSEIDAQVRRQINRPAEAHQRLAAARRQLEEIGRDLAAPPATGESQAFTEARRWSLLTRQRSLKAEIQTLDQELLGQPVRLELLQAQRDQAARSLALVSDQVTLLQTLADERRVAEVQQAREEAAAAREGVAGKHPLLQRLAEQNAILTSELAASTTVLEKINQQLQAVKRRTKRYEADFEDTRQKLEVAGLSEALGQLLLEQRRQLPDLRSVRRALADRAQITSSLGLQQIRHSEERRDLGELDRVLDRLLGDVPEQVRDELRPEAVKLLTSRRDLLDKAIALEAGNLRSLTELDLAERQLIDLVTAFDTFLAENLLWIRSVEPMDGAVLAGVADELGRVVSPANWQAAAVALGRAALQRPVLLLGIVLVAVLIWRTPHMRGTVVGNAVKVGDPRHDRFLYTVQAMLLVFLRALPWPLLVWLIGWRLEGQINGTGFVWGFSHALQVVAPVYLNLRVFALLCEPDGVGERHFHWPVRNVRLLRRQLRVLLWTLLPTAFLVVLASSRGVGSEALGLSRLAFVALMLALAYFFARILSLREGLARAPMVAKPHGLLSRLRYVWYPLAVGTTLVIAGLALSGYFYTAGMLTRSLVNSLWLILGLVLVHDLAVRWLLLLRLRISLHELQQQAALEQAVKPQGDVPPVAPPTLDIASVDAGTRKLLNTALQLSLFVGLWLIWSAVLPAFAVLRDVALWQHLAMVDGNMQPMPITLADLALAVLIGIITAAVARNLPNVFEIVLLRQLDVEPGTRYAYATLLRYLVVGIGVVMVFSTVGGSWSEIQWLVAALGVGIGFGLQEIVANFVSGLVILFERPIRVGDIVSVGDTSGVVSRIRIRATTITTWDRQELLVPNKEFITTRLLNWSLSDPINRVTVAVGIAYGSDADEAMRLLAEVAEEHPNVLTDPAPLILFERFGDNALELSMRCYLPNMDNRLRTVSEVNSMIYRKFNAAGIVIAFPQRDVHLDSSRPLEVRVSTARDNDADRGATS